MSFFSGRDTARIAAAVLLLMWCTGCGIVRTVAGADIDAEQFAASREAAVTRIRADAATALARRLENREPVTQADVVVTFGTEAVNKALAQVVGVPGRLDEQTPYVVRGATAALRNGCAIVSLALDARNEDYAVDVRLLMDCVLTLSFEKDGLVARLEPFNIAPDVSAGGLLSAASDIIRDLIKVRLARLGEDLPPIVLPVESASTFPVEGSRVQVRSGINLDIDSPRRVLRTTLRIKEALFFEGRMLVALNLANAEAK
ncbi:MAG: hypothetical protein HY962_15080 [Ignavibacteriae bacterium]|nr:hypothetical protein [Ignavibacteriota bacterium]